MTKNTILKEAMIEHKQIVDAANIAAQKKLAEQFPEKFSQFLKEELDTDNNKEDKDKEAEKETEKQTLIDSKEKPEDKQKDNEAELEPEKTKNDNMKKVNENEDFNVNDLDLEENETENGDFLTIDQIEDEINKMEELADIADDNEQPVDFDAELETSMDNMGDDSMLDLSDDELDAQITQALSEYNFDDEDIDLDFDELDIDDVKGELEKDFPEMSDEQEFELELDEDDIEEGHGISHARRKGVDGKLPRKGQGLPTSHEKQLRYAMQESKRLKKLMEDNKKVTKRLNELRKESSLKDNLVEKYKTAISKYRGMLEEMAVFNTNLAHVNNILVNENFTLTQDEKVEIIKEFKEVKSINDSKSVYTKHLNRLTEGVGTKKQNVSENIERKLNNSSIESSSKKKLDEVTEKNAYTNNAHVDKIKKLFEYKVGKTNRI